MKKVILIVLAVALALVLPVAAMAQNANEWRQYQKDERHAGAININLPATNKVSGRTENIGAYESSQPVVAGNRAFVHAGVAGTSGAIYCYDLSTGKKIWNTSVEPVSAWGSWSSPAISEGVVYIGSGSKVQALDAASGKLLWTKDLTTIKANADVVNSSPAIDGNRLIIGDYNNGCYYCLDISQKGKLLWNFSLEASTIGMSTACIVEGRVFVGQSAALGAPVNPNGKVWCVDESTGKAVTSWGTSGYYMTVGKLDVCGTVTAYGDFIYFTDFSFGAASAPNCYLYCLNKGTGKEAWKAGVYGTDGSPAVTDGLVVTAGQQQPGAWPTPGTNWATAFSADTATGKNPKQLWTKSGMGGYTMSACIANGKVAVGNISTGWPSVGAGVQILNPADGSTIWQSTEGGGPAVPTPYGLLSIGNGKMITFGGGAVPNGDYYFAEGTTRDGYQEWICLENPTAGKVNTTIDYMMNDGGARSQKVELAGGSRTTVDVNLFLGANLDVSARVTGDGYFVAERSMYFNADGQNGGEQVMGVTEPAQRFLYAEGTTRNGFKTWLALQNPGDVDANVLVTYLYADGSAPGQQNIKLGANSRQTIDVNLEVGADKDVSIAITANHPLVSERVTYFTHPDEILGSAPNGVHNCTGVAVAGTNWYFAEGTTRGNFKEYLCLMNPGSRDTTATIQYMKASGSAQTVTKELKANSRTTVNVTEDVGSGQDVSARVTSPEAIVAERPMYFQYQPAGDGTATMWKGGHDSAGAAWAAYRWEFAEGCTREGFRTFLCIANPNNANVEVNISYYTFEDTGALETKTAKVDVAANSRQTILVNDAVGQGKDVSMNVSCSRPIVVERPMYFSFNGYTDGGVSPGLPGAL
ncbi:MAG: hypothetical protein CVT63_04845 [Candidatus Anoxymicrobium japonicum]|uniref:Pyrrolo-quinoline quinone repeat domain-containing protein n=1 Tax=Candidatus Anoxymicrobium japonicum TaxID=2013648 RepID=A0A2N3G5P4_9ACTN|nr:MAG: hypothetical protein CVT63_04845 [Candidatus Anoxymicrobium japonicum]